MGDYSRRDFIKVTSCAMGGLILAGCGSGSGGAGGGITTPNGYYFYRLKSAGGDAGAASRSLPVYEFGSSAHIGRDGIITFDAYDVDGRQGMFQLDVDFTDRKPLIAQEHTPLLAGDVLPDGRAVKKFLAHDVNSDGNIAAVIRASGDNGTPLGTGLYLNDARSGFDPVVGVGDTFHQNRYKSTGIVGDVSLQDDNDLLVVLNHLTGSNPQTGLFQLPGAALSASMQVMQTGQFLSGTEEQVTGFGIVDHKGDVFSTTISHSSSGLLGAQQDGSGGSVNSLLHGSLGSANDLLLLSAGPNVAGSTHTAVVHYGPRVAPDGTIYTKIADQYNERLIAGDQVIKTTDGVTAKGYKITSFTPGCVGPDGVFYYTEYAETETDGLRTSLFAYDGAEHKIILASGDTLSDGGSPVKNIFFSTTTNHIADDGKIVFLCEFADRSSAIVVGIPA